VEIWLALCGLALPAFGQSAMVSGQVTETLHGQPVARVTVELRGPARGTPPVRDVYSTQTNSDGHFQLRGVAPGRYTVGYSRLGFVWPVRPDGSTAAPPPIIVQPSGQQTLALRLTPTGVISGRVLDADGDPVRNVNVQLLQYGYATGKRALNPRGAAGSNDRGEFRLFTVVPGAYYLQASGQPMIERLDPNGTQLRGPRPTGGYAATYYPNARDAASAVPLPVAPGEELSHIDIHLQSEMVYSLHIRLQDTPSPNAMPSFNLLRRSPDGPQFNWSIPAFPSNNFTGLAAVPPGSYLLVGRLKGPTGSDMLLARQPVEIVDHDVEMDAPAFTAGFDLAGSVQVAPAPFPLPKLRVALRSDFPDGIPEPAAAVSAEGTFTLHGVLRDSYTVLLTPPAGTYLQGLKLGDRALPDLRLDLAGSTAPLTILLATDGGHIRGLVENADGETAPGIGVTLYPEGSQRDPEDRARTALTDEAGKYEIKDIAPGDYRLYAWDFADLPASRDPDFRQTFESQSTAVTVAAGGTLAVALKTVVAH
jgi:protocatechuate 3,4-dioxygenase beta subunit